MGGVGVRCYGAWKAWKATFIDSVLARIHEAYAFQFSVFKYSNRWRFMSWRHMLPVYSPRLTSPLSFNLAPYIAVPQKGC
jgi:hypothetical protein